MVLYTVKFVTYKISGEKYIYRYLLLQLKLSQKDPCKKVSSVSPSFKFILFLENIGQQT